MHGHLDEARITSFALLPALFMASSAGCSATRLTAVWKDGAYAGGAFRRIAVIALFTDPAGRRTYETVVAECLRKHGSDAIEGHSFMAPDRRFAYAALEKKLNDLKVDGVLIIRLKAVERSAGVARRDPELLVRHNGRGAGGHVLDRREAGETHREGAACGRAAAGSGLAAPANRRISPTYRFSSRSKSASMASTTSPLRSPRLRIASGVNKAKVPVDFAQMCPSW